MSLTFGSLFAGIGGMDLGLERAGMVCKWQVEIKPYAIERLSERWPNVPKWDDVRTFPPAAGEWGVDLIAGGFPCQDISNAGPKIGISGERSGLWSEFARIIHSIRPSYVIVENVPALLVRGIDRVLGDLASLGFNAEWEVLSACSFGAPHPRERLFIMAYAKGSRWVSSQDPFSRVGPEDVGEAGAIEAKPVGGCDIDQMRRWWVCEPELAPVADGLSAKLVDQPNRAIGNAIVPQVAEWIGRRILKCSIT